jgi:hypothetical protein
VDLAGNADRFDADLVTATRNPFVYTFGGKLHLFCSAPFYADLQSVTAWADEVSKPGRLNAANQQLALRIEAVWAANLRNGVNAAPGTSQLASLAKLKTVMRAAHAKLKASSQPTASGDAIANLINSVPAIFRPWVSEYAPVLIRIGIGDLDALISQLLGGDPLPIYRAALVSMTEDELMADGATITEPLAQTVTDNAAKVAAEKQAAMAALSLGLTLLFSFIGL